MNELMIFDTNNEVDFANLEHSRCASCGGFCYVIEFGSNVKIGWSFDPVSRVKSLKQLAKYALVELGRIVITRQHLNCCENEKKLHEFYATHRINGTELFRIDFDEAIRTFPTLDYNLSFEEEERRIVARSDTMIQSCKNLWEYKYKRDEANLIAEWINNPLEAIEKLKERQDHYFRLIENTDILIEALHKLDCQNKELCALGIMEEPVTTEDILNRMSKLSPVGEQ